MSRAARARRLQVLVRGSVQPVVATAVVPGAVSGADSAERAGAPADYVATLRALPCAKMGDSNTAYEGPEGAGGP